MTTRILISLVSLALAGTLTGCAGDSATTVADNDPSRTICRNEPNTGSRLPKRVCKTAAEWDEIAAQNQEELRNLSRRQAPGGAASEGGRVQ